MNKSPTDSMLYDEEILSYDLPDAALEVAASKVSEPAGNPFTIAFCTGLDTCPAWSSDVAAVHPSERRHQKERAAARNLSGRDLVRFTPKADIAERGADVRFMPEADITHGRQAWSYSITIGGRAVGRVSAIGWEVVQIR
jgi:hypothetical protein